MSDDILDALAGDQRVGGQRCLTCRWLQSLDDDTARQFRVAFATMTYSTKSIWRQARQHGYTGHSTSIENHRGNHTTPGEPDKDWSIARPKP